MLSILLRILSAGKVEPNQKIEGQRIKIAIVGAGSIGVNLAAELMNNPNSAYTPRCFIESNAQKIGRQIQDIPVFSEDDYILDVLAKHDVQEVVFAIPEAKPERKKQLYEFYTSAGFKVKVYDYPIMNVVGGRRELRAFDVEELLFRKPVVVVDDHTSLYYQDKIVMITGGGGSIGSELCRQLAKMSPPRGLLFSMYTKTVLTTSNRN